MTPLRLAFSCLALVAVLFASHQSTATADTQCCGYTVTGYVWHDVNANGTDESEPRLAGWTVHAYNASSSYLAATTTTDSLGMFTFISPVGCGPDAVFSLVLQPGWTQTFPTSPSTYTFTAIGGCGSMFENVNFAVTGGPCLPHTETWTLDGEFNTGVLNGAVAASDNLELTPTPTTFGFAWVANSNGTVSRIDIATGNEVARYYTGPPDTNGYNHLAPSRTAVDADGNCWVLNREFGGQASVTQILATGGIDRNTNTTIETSQDNATVNGIIDPTEILPWGQDERVARHYLVGTGFPDNVGRALAIDKMGFLWVGLNSGQRVVKLDPTLSTVTYAPDLTPVAPPELATVNTAPHMPYGLALSPSGMLYCVPRSSFVLEIDPGVASGGTSAGPAVTQLIEHPVAGNYGVAVDQDCIVWITASHIPSTSDFGCIRWDPTVGVGVPSLGWSYSQPGGLGFGRGITVDFDGNVWMTTNDSSGTVTKYAPTDPATFLANYSSGTIVPVGVGVATDQNIIIIDSASSAWTKLNKNTGALIPLAGPQLAGPNPYTYSDFTGSLQSIVNQQQGFWTAISDAGTPTMLWTTISWNETTPAGTGVGVEYRVANTIGGLASLSWTVAPGPGPLSSAVPGQFMEVRVRLSRNVECGVPFVTPLLHDITVHAICDDCALGPCEPIIVECDSPAGAVVSYQTPVLNSPECDGGPITCTPASGSLFPIGTTTVRCSTVTVTGDTLVCEFPVIVTGNCGEVTGGCCIDDHCTQATEAECAAAGGVYLGDDSDCTNGCDFTCQRPPGSMLAWYPLDSAPGGITQNLANPSVPAVASGTPIQNPSQWVTASYGFQRTDAADEFRADDHPTLDFYTSDFTLDAWVRTSNFQGINPILDKRQDAPLQGYHLFLVNGYPGVQLAVGGSWSNWTLTAADGPAAYVADGQWHFVAVTVDRNHPAGLKFYVDGVQVGTSMNPTALTGNAGSTGDLVMGRSLAAGGNPITWWDGDLDEVEIFRRALSRDEIGAIYNAGTTGKCREACYLPNRIVVCNGTTVTTSVTICNYDDVPHLYSWGLYPSSAGCTTPAASFSPAYGSVNVNAGDCVSIPVTIQVPSSLPQGGTSCFDVSILNHDTGRYFGCTGSIQKNKWWCVSWKGNLAKPIHGLAQVNPAFGLNAKLIIAHIGPISPGTVLTAELRPVKDDDETQPSENLALDGLPPGMPVTRQIDIPDDGSEVEVPVAIELLDQLYLGAEKIQVWADDDMDQVMEPIAEMIVRSTTQIPTGVTEGPPPAAGRAFRMVPNPFNPQATISFSLPGRKPVPVSLRIFDLRGRKVKTLYASQTLQPGLHTVVWAGDDKRGNKVASGVYMVQLVTPDFTETVKAVLLK